MTNERLNTMVYDDIALNSAVIFMHTVNVLKERANGVNSKPKDGMISIKTLDLALNVSIIVNSALAIEIIIKSMLPKQHRTHNHKLLFEQLDENLKKRICKSTVKKMQKINGLYNTENFKQDLEQNKLCFNEWRYFYEGNSPKANFLFIENFMNALFEIAKVERRK